jgi:hypothetical protein
MNNAEINSIVDRALSDISIETPEAKREKLSKKISMLYKDKKISKVEMVELKIDIAGMTRDEVDDLYRRVML